MDPSHPEASAVTVGGNMILGVWDEAPSAEVAGTVIDAAGASIIPGLVDAHLHIAGLGTLARQLDLTKTVESTQVLEAVRAAATKRPAGSWILGRGWDQTRWSGRGWPSAEMLDEVAPDHPVVLSRIDGHAVWANSEAMRLAGVDAATPSPIGGEILRDRQGAPSGVFVDNATALITGHATSLDDSELRAAIKEALARCRALGLTGVHDMGTTPRELAILRSLNEAHELPVRVTVYLGGPIEGLREELARGPSGEGMLRVVGVKRYADGALGSRGAAMLEPYSDDKRSRGLLVTDPAELTRQATLIHAAGFQLAIHAIGDRGNRAALDAIDAAQGEDHSRRHRVEHAQIVDSADVKRFSTLAVIASMQPTHATSDMRWAEDRVGRKRLRGAYAWRTLVQAGTQIVFGSDAPVEEVNPWLGIYAAITRQDLSGQPAAGWRASERLTWQEALAAFTTAAWFAAGEDPARGMIRVGAVADLTIVDGDLAVMTPMQLSQVKAREVVVNGTRTVLAHP